MATTDPSKARDSSTPTISALSAAAPVFSPAAPPPDVSNLDYFAQTGSSQDDLFDSITPIDDSMRVRSEDDLFSDEFTPATEPVIERLSPRPNRGQNRGRGDVIRGRGRGRGRGEAQARGGPPPRPTQPNGQSPKEQEAAPPNDVPASPQKPSISSVRGDRQATGGVRKPKLTEAELAEKMARIKIKNASLTAAHAKAEADAASFAEREKQAKEVASQKQKEERRDRQQMMGEREKNRMRKLKAMEGREWDAEKTEDDFRRGGKFDKKGGFAGDNDGYSDGREYLYQEPRGGARGGRGGGAGRGAKEQQQNPPRQEEFPALPSLKQDGDAVGGAAGKSWADQVESTDPS